MSAADPTAPSDSSSVRTIAGAAVVLGLFGFLVGAAVNQGAKRFFTLPADAKVRTYVDAEQKGGDAAPGSPTVDEPGPDMPGLASSHGSSLRTYEDAILRRNLFDSTAVYDPDAAKASTGSMDCKESKVRLLGTVFAPNQPEFSSVLVVDGGTKDGRAVGYATGEDIPGEGRIAWIDQNKVCLESGGCICVGMEPKATAAAGDAGAGGDDITKLGDGKFQVAKSFLDSALGNVETLATQVRAVPHKDGDGNIDGFRLSAIRKGSLFEKLGIKNGDVINSVNGQPFTSAEGALSTYQSLKNESHFSFEITRRNQRQTLDYEVR